jgi:cytochrome c biogenesis protein CcmG/thiol:disulfide interchange protein DsbE
MTGCSGQAQGPEIGKPAPDFELSSLDGQVVSLSDFRGKPVFLNFWATWCGPCRFEMPLIQEMYEGLSSEGLVVLAVNLREDPAKVREFMATFGFTFPVLMATSHEVPLAYNIRGIPATFLIDENGIIQDIKIGVFTSEVEMASRVRKIMP